MRLVPTTSDFLVCGNDVPCSASLKNKRQRIPRTSENHLTAGKNTHERAEKEGCARDVPFRSAALRATLGALALKPMTVLLSQSALLAIVGLRGGGGGDERSALVMHCLVFGSILSRCHAMIDSCALAVLHSMLERLTLKPSARRSAELGHLLIVDHRHYASGLGRPLQASP